MGFKSFTRCFAVASITVMSLSVAVPAEATDLWVNTRSCVPASVGEWCWSADGGVFAYDGAPFYGSAVPYRPVDSIVGMLPTPDGQGYWLLGADGGVFSFGDAEFLGRAHLFPLVTASQVRFGRAGDGYTISTATSSVQFEPAGDPDLPYPVSPP